MNWYYHARIGMNMFYFWKEITKLSKGLVIPCIIGFIIMKYVNIIGIVKLGMFVIIYVVVYLFSMYFFGMNSTEKNLVLGPFKKIFKI